MKTIVSKDGSIIRFAELGSGPSLIIIGDNNFQKTGPLIYALSILLRSHFTVIQYNRRPAKKLRIASPDHELEDLGAMLIALGGSALVLGLASGATLALRASQAGLPISKLVVFEKPFSLVTHGKAINQFSIGAVFKLFSFQHKGQTIKTMMKIIGWPKVLLGVAGFALLWPAIRALMPALVHDALTVNQQISDDQIGDTSPAIYSLSGKTNALKDIIVSILQQFPKVCHDLLATQIHDVDTKVLGTTLVELFSSALVKQK